MSIIVEPAKVLFLNNAINHGVFTPLGIEQAAETGKSILFLIEANPGPGLGLLLAFTFFGVGAAKASAPGAVIIQFFGGIHEIYFPYALIEADDDPRADRGWRRPVSRRTCCSAAVSPSRRRPAASSP